MRVGFIIGWLLLLPAFWLWHSGPGQAKMQIDTAGRAIGRGDELVRAGDLTGARQWYADALQSLPEASTAERRRLQLALARIDLQDGKLPEAHQALKGLVEECLANPGVDAATTRDARAALAQSQYYMTWLMRLEGLPQAEWEPEIDSARQIYRLLSESARAAGNSTEAAQYQEDLESAIRLARMNLDDLQGLNLPKQCKGCCSGKCKKPGKKPGTNKPKDARGASGGPPPDDGGH